MPAPVPAAIAALVARFREHRAAYVAGDYNETQVRREYLDPFFEALGWDVANKEGNAQAYQDVVHEDKVKVGRATKAPDYSFRIGGTRKFFVEAKKPAVNIKDELDPAFQVRRYAFSAGLPLSILTDFDEFAVYDCRHKPSPKDKPSKHRLFYCKFDEYEKNWDFIAGHFSREAIKKGAFDKLAAEKGGKQKGTATVDAEFLAQLEEWRDQLAQNIALRNPRLDAEGLNFSVQATLDRLVFLRIAEDRGIEPLFQLKGKTNGDGVYPRLCELFRHADRKYNSGLFHFEDEKGRAGHADTLTQDLQLDDKVLQGIVRGMYLDGGCPFAFEVMPAEILGSAYERFLGKVIRLTEGHRAKVEDKPEVKKAGGVFYTPAYIVQHIVRATLGPLLEGKTPAEALRLRVLDPACGSGSFLLGAYQYLLDWHLAQLLPDAAKHAKGNAPALVETAGGWKLSTRYRKQVLTGSLFGVDIDAQAVEVTKLSLLLKVLEGETEETLGAQFKLFAERALPDLDANIRCGNSLIGPEFYAKRLVDDLTDAEKKRVNAFDWTAMAEVPKTGAKSRARKEAGTVSLFDAVIGNPPYIRIQAMQEFAPLEVEHYKDAYASAAKGNYDIYVVFVEKGLALLNKGGRLGFILPHKFMNAQYGAPLRSLLVKRKAVESIVHFGDQQVFDSATTYTCLLFLAKDGCEKVRVERVADLSAWREGVAGEKGEVGLAEGEWNLSVGEDAELFERLAKMPVKLGDVAERIAQGIRTSANEVYVLDVRSEKNGILTAYSKQLDREVPIERAAVMNFLQGREIKAFSIEPSGKVVLMPYRMVDGRAGLIPEKEYKAQFPKAWAYLLENRKYLEGREKGKMKHDGWYGFVYPKNLEVMCSPKIICPDIADRGAFALDEKGEYALTSGYGITLKPDAKISEKYILAMLNSPLLTDYLRHVSTPMRGGFFRLFAQFLEQMPVAMPDIKGKGGRGQHDHIVALVSKMQVLRSDFGSAATPTEKNRLECEIALASSLLESAAAQFLRENY